MWTSPFLPGTTPGTVMEVLLFSIYVAELCFNYYIDYSQNQLTNIVHFGTLFDLFAVTVYAPIFHTLIP